MLVAPEHAPTHDLPKSRVLEGFASGKHGHLDHKPSGYPSAKYETSLYFSMRDIDDRRYEASAFVSNMAAPLSHPFTCPLLPPYFPLTLPHDGSQDTFSVITVKLVISDQAGLPVQTSPRTPPNCGTIVVPLWYNASLQAQTLPGLQASPLPTCQDHVTTFTPTCL